MKSVKINENENLININNEYYVLNNSALTFYNSFIKSRGKIKKEKIDEFKNKLFNAKYYDGNIRLKAPLKLQWKITNNCNLKCKHCYLGKLEYKIEDENVRNMILEKICQANIFEVTISGGEALMVGNLEYIVQRLLENNIRVNIFTNAVLLKNFLKLCEKNYIIRNNKNKIKFMISLDGLKKEHDYIRGKGNYNITFKAIKYAVKKKYKIVVNTVLSKFNYLVIPDMVKTLYKSHVSNIQISNLIITGSADETMKLTLEEEKDVEKKLKKVIKKLKKIKLFYSTGGNEEEGLEISSILKKENKVLGVDTWQCCAGVGKATIDYMGNMFCCPFLKESYIGNIINDGITNIWNRKERFLFLKKLTKENKGKMCIVKRRGKSGEHNK